MQSCKFSLLFDLCSRRFLCCCSGDLDRLRRSHPLTHGKNEYKKRQSICVFQVTRFISRTRPMLGWLRLAISICTDVDTQRLILCCAVNQAVTHGAGSRYVDVQTWRWSMGVPSWPTDNRWTDKNICGYYNLCFAITYQLRAINGSHVRTASYHYVWFISLTNTRAFFNLTINYDAANRGDGAWLLKWSSESLNLSSYRLWRPN